MDRNERLATNVSPEVKRRFRAEAGRRDLNMSELLRELVHEWLEEHEGEDIEGNTDRLATPSAPADD